MMNEKNLSIQDLLDALHQDLPYHPDHGELVNPQSDQDVPEVKQLPPINNVCAESAEDMVNSLRIIEERGFYPDFPPVPPSGPDFKDEGLPIIPQSQLNCAPCENADPEIKEIPPTEVRAESVGDLLNSLRIEETGFNPDFPPVPPSDPEFSDDGLSIVPKSNVSAALSLEEQRKATLARARRDFSSGKPMVFLPDGTMSVLEDQKNASPSEKITPKTNVSGGSDEEDIPVFNPGPPDDDGISICPKSTVSGGSDEEDIPVFNPGPPDDEGISICPKTTVSGGSDEEDIPVFNPGPPDDEGVSICPKTTVSGNSNNEDIPVFNPGPPDDDGISICPKTNVSAPQWYNTNFAHYQREVAAWREAWKNPNLKPQYDEFGRMYWRARCKPVLGPGFEREKIPFYTLRLVYDQDHPACRCGSSIMAFVDNPTLEEMQREINKDPALRGQSIPHLLYDDLSKKLYLCSAGSGDTSADYSQGLTTAVTSFKFAYRWLTLFEYSKRDPDGMWKDFCKHGVV